MTPINIHCSLFVNAQELSKDDKNNLYNEINLMSVEAFSHDLGMACNKQECPETALRNWYGNIKRIFTPHSLDSSDTAENATRPNKRHKSDLDFLISKINSIYQNLLIEVDCTQEHYAQKFEEVRDPKIILRFHDLDTDKKVSITLHKSIATMSLLLNKVLYGPFKNTHELIYPIDHQDFLHIIRLLYQGAENLHPFEELADYLGIDQYSYHDTVFVSDDDFSISGNLSRLAIASPFVKSLLEHQGREEVLDDRVKIVLPQSTISPEFYKAYFDLLEKNPHYLTDPENFSSLINNRNVLELRRFVENEKCESLTILFLAALTHKLTQTSDPGIQTNCIKILGYIAQQQPALITAQAVEALNQTLPQASDPVIKTLCSLALRLIATNRPELITAQVVEALTSTLTRPANPGIQTNCIKALGLIAQQQPALITAHAVGALFSALTQVSDTSIKAFCSMALCLITKNRPELITAPVVEAFTSTLTQTSDSEIQTSCCMALVHIAKEQPALITALAVEALSSTLIQTAESQTNIQANCSEALLHISLNYLALITPLAVEALSSILNKTPYQGIKHCCSAPLLFIAINRSELITAPVVEAFTSVLIETIDPSFKTSCIKALGITAQNKPELITAHAIEALNQILAQTSGPVIRTLCQETLAKITENCSITNQTNK